MKSLIATIVALFAFVAVVNVYAATTEPSVCRRDIQKYCKGMSPGSGDLKSCLLRNQDLLGPSCRQNVQAFWATDRTNRLALPAQTK